MLAWRFFLKLVNSSKKRRQSIIFVSRFTFLQKSPKKWPNLDFWPKSWILVKNPCGLVKTTWRQKDPRTSEFCRESVSVLYFAWQSSLAGSETITDLVKKLTKMSKITQLCQKSLTGSGIRIMHDILYIICIIYYILHMIYYI